MIIEQQYYTTPDVKVDPQLSPGVRFTIGSDIAPLDKLKAFCTDRPLFVKRRLSPDEIQALEDAIDINDSPKMINEGDEVSIDEFMRLQEKSGSFDFLNDPAEDIYSEKDCKPYNEAR